MWRDHWVEGIVVGVKKEILMFGYGDIDERGRYYYGYRHDFPLNE
jgi:hypothetical protein